jgi:hypothetical protein
MALQKEQATSISRWAIITKESFFSLGVLSGLPPLSLVDLFHSTSEGFGF